MWRIGERKHSNNTMDGSEKKDKIKISWNLRCILCFLPSLLGISIFYLIPYLRVFYYSIINNQFQRKIVWLENYKTILKNTYFLLALKNSLLLIVIGVPVLVILAIVFSLLLTFSLNKIPAIRDIFIFPFLIPTAGIILIWQQLFSNVTSVMPIYTLYIWKNIGICIVLLTSAITTISETLFEAARLDGANGLQLHRKITIPVIIPTIFFTVLLSIVNSFKVFKESYLYYGNKYPPDHSYTLQFYMNNNFLKFDYQALATSSILTSVLVLIIVVMGLMIQRRYQS